ncbi:MAG: sigma-54 dependent transcriptional regulator [Vicinamibacterales bacterium]
MNARIALVDDDAAFAEYVELLLRTKGYDVEVHLSGNALLQALQNGATPHVILLDVEMPDLDGIETLRAIRRAHPTAEAIMLSGKQAPATIVEAIRLGAADYVIKGGGPGGLGEAALEAAIRHALERQSMSAEIERLGAQLAEDPQGIQPYWSDSHSMSMVMDMVDRVADSTAGVLLRGESGVGKEVIARELHRRSSRRTQQFVKVNCAALPVDLLESELFGHERGAFTGAGATRVGKFEFANRGTILLDEIGEMPAALQAKLLHVLQDGAITRLGSNQQIDADVRILAATNRDLEAMMRAGTFREDLYYRLQVIEIRVPPLRDRREEIPALVEYFVSKYSGVYRRPFRRPTRALVDALVAYNWPGNIRELENMMKRLVVLQEEALIFSELQRQREVPRPSAQSAPITAESAPVHAQPRAAGAATAVAVSDDAPRSESVDLPTLARAAAQRAERKAIDETLTRFHWNRRKAATHLGVSYKTLLNKMKECGISDREPAH